MVPVTPILVRSVRVDDAPSVLPLLESVGFPASVRQVEFRLREWGLSPVLVAEVEGLVVGLITVTVTRVLHRLHPVGRITLLAVAPERQGGGVGRALVEAAEAHCARADCELIEVVSNHRYLEAHGFYEHLGYLRTSHRFRKAL